VSRFGQPCPFLASFGQFWPILSSLLPTGYWLFFHRAKFWAESQEKFLFHGGCGRSRSLPEPKAGSKHETHAPQHGHVSRRRRGGRRPAQVGAARHHGPRLATPGAGSNCQRTSPGFSLFNSRPASISRSTGFVVIDRANRPRCPCALRSGNCRDHRHGNNAPRGSTCAA